MFLSKLLRKQAYGYDTQGVVHEENQLNQHDTKDQRDKVENAPSPVNMSVDREALKDFPELRKKPNRYPSRTEY